MKWLCLIGGGVCGTLGRYVLSGAVHRWLGTSFPYGTLVVNLLGCFIIGILATLADQKFLLNSNARLFAMVGLLGAFTTFSSLIYESYKLLEDGQVLFAGFNLIGSCVLGLLAFWAGSSLASLI